MKPLPPPDIALALEIMGERAEALQGARVLVTGGTGFFGVWGLHVWAALSRSLDIQVWALSRDPERFRREHPALSGVNWITGDVRDFRADRRFTHAILGATPVSPQMVRDEPERMFNTIVDGTRHSLAQLGGATRVVFVSSGAVYGADPGTGAPFAETSHGAPDPFDAGACYGLGKLAAEHIVATWGRRNGAITPIARPFAFVGPYLPMNTHFAVGNFLADAVARRPIVVGGDGTPIRSYLHGAELAAQLWSLLAVGDNLAYNIGSDEALSIRELAERVGEIGGVPVEVRGVPVPGKPPASYVPETKRIHALGLHRRLTTEQALRRTWAWLAG